MYIFPSGSGCSGEPTLVKPGDELPFGKNSLEIGINSDLVGGSGFENLAKKERDVVKSEVCSVQPSLRLIVLLLFKLME